MATNGSALVQYQGHGMKKRITYTIEEMPIEERIIADAWDPARQLAKQLGYDAQRWNALVHQQVTGTPEKALAFLQEQARSLLNKRAAEQESEEDAHLIPDEMLADALEVAR